MLITIPNVLDATQIAHARKLLAEADWVDGRVTAGHQSAQAKDNLQIPEGHPAARQVGEITRTALLAMQQCYPLIADVRGLGALIGVELRTPDGQPAKDLTSKLVTSARDEGLLLLAGGADGNVLRMLAPLTVELRTLEAVLRILDRCFSMLCRPEPGRHD